jgi:hypothetical protein
LNGICSILLNPKSLFTKRTKKSCRISSLLPYAPHNSSLFFISQPSHPALSRTKPKRKVVVVVNEDEFDDQDYVGDEEDEVHEGSDDEDDMNFKFNDS